MRQTRLRSFAGRAALGGILLLIVVTSLASRQRQAAAFSVPAGGPIVEWPTADGVQGTHHSALADITPENVAALEVAWTYRTGDVSDGKKGRGATAFEATPVMVDGVLYFSTPASRVVALDAETGRELWTFDAGFDQAAQSLNASRGVSTWLDPERASGEPCRRRVFLAAPTDESVPLPELPAADAYGRSKQEAERLVLDAHARGRVWAAVVRPPVMYGPRDRQFVPRVGPVLERGLFPLIAGGRTTLTLVHADAVADGAIRAATTDRAAGRVYHLTNDFDVTVADLVRFASRGLRRRVLAPRVPGAVGRAAFRLLAVALVTAGRRDLAPHAVGLLLMLTRDNPFTSERARRELAWAPTIRPAEGLAEAFSWWKGNR